MYLNRWVQFTLHQSVNWIPAKAFHKKLVPKPTIKRDVRNLTAPTAIERDKSLLV